MRDLDGNVNWHSGATPLYDVSTDVLSVSGSALGLFCFQPRKRGFAQEITTASWNGEKRKAFFIENKLRGMVPLFPGDLLIMSGECQVHLDHQTKESGTR